MKSLVRDYLNEVVFASVNTEVFFRDNCFGYEAVGDVGKLLAGVVDDYVEKLCNVGDELTSDDIERAEKAYYDKPLQITGKTWTHDEYSSVPFQFVFVAHKLVRRIVHASEMFTRAYNLGIIRDAPSRLVCIGCGPGIESAVFMSLYSHFFGKVPALVNVDPANWGAWHENGSFIQKKWQHSDVIRGDHFLTSFVLEHYVFLPIKQMVERGHLIFSVEKDYFPRLPCFKNTCDQTGRDKTHGVYCDYRYSHDHYHCEKLPFVLRRSTGVASVRSWYAINVHRGSLRAKDVFNEAATMSGLIVDWGAGDGMITSALRKISTQVVGVDVNPQFPGCYTPGAVGDVVEDGSVDVVTAFMSLHHIADLRDSLDRIHRMLRKDGLFYIREHDADSCDSSLVYAMHLLEGAVKNEDWVGYMNLRSLDQWKTILRQAGFHAVRVSHVVGPTGVIKIACVKVKARKYTDDAIVFPRVPVPRYMYESVGRHYIYVAGRLGYTPTVFMGMLWHEGTFPRLLLKVQYNRRRLIKDG